MDVRIDKWLWAVRIYKSRSLASAACSAGKVRVGGEPLKPSRSVRIGEVITAATGDIFRGKVLVNHEPLDFGGSAENLGDALFRLGNEKAGDGGREIWFWLGAYGRPAEEIDAYQERWTTHLRKLFPESQE